jgi:hypothetical protein
LTAAAKFIQRAEQLFRIAVLVGQKVNEERLLAVTQDYLRMAEVENPDAIERAQIAEIRANIEDRQPDEGTAD